MAEECDVDCHTLTCTVKMNGLNWPRGTDLDVTSLPIQFQSGPYSIAQSCPP